ncbi:MAG: ABC transporter permease [Ferruginibacter sp.]|nr:ABC transporter permease [Cytophagales bacterium]
MLRNYLVIALRNLGRNQVYSFINVFGLAVGMATSVLILLWVQDERSYDAFHRHADRTYRVLVNFRSGGSSTYESTQSPLAGAALKEIPEVHSAVRLTTAEEKLFTFGDQAFTEKRGLYVDPSFFEVFDVSFLKGNARTALPDTRSVVITQSVARKYFGNGNALGQVIRVGNAHDYRVTGVVKDFPANTHLQFDCFFSFQAFREMGYDLDNDWGNYNYFTYLLLRENVSAGAVAPKLSAILQRRAEKGEPQPTALLQPLQSIHLDTDSDGRADTQTIDIFTVVAGLILLIACINYVNLATARATQRAKEVGVRKVIGANRSQLVGQFLGESAIVFGLALGLALLLIGWLIPLYNDVSGKELAFNLTDRSVWSVLLLTGATTLLVAGGYPALLLSSFQPLKVMKGNYLPAGGNATFRRGLVVAQFTFSTALVIGTLVIGKQLRYIQQKKLGYDRENVFAVTIQGDIGRHLRAAKGELLQQPGIVGATVASGNLLRVYSSSVPDWEGRAPNVNVVMNQLSVDGDFLRVFNVEMAQGRGFSPDRADSNAYVLNEEAVRQMGMKDPVGKRFTFHGVPGTIIGVTRNFHFQSVHEKIEPFVFFQSPGWVYQFFIKTTGKETQRAVAGAEKVWKRFNPAYPFEYTFLDETFDQMYRTDQRTGKLFDAFALVAILISCLGLFGLVTYTAETRTREIGIRKVLGASVASITAMLSKDFLRLVLLANVIAWPLAWWAMNQWLADFAYRIDVGWWPFALAGGAALVIALLTVGYQAIKAAMANPVKSLRTE